MRQLKKSGTTEIVINEYVATRFELPLQISVQKKINGSDEIRPMCESTDLSCVRTKCAKESTEGNVI